MKPLDYLSPEASDFVPVHLRFVEESSILYLRCAESDLNHSSCYK